MAANDRPIKVAILGTGTMGRLYAQNLGRMNGVEAVGVYGRTLKSAEEAAAECGAQAFVSFEEMMDRTDPDVVCVCLPTFLHKEWALQIAERGKHVVCEKPIAGNLADAREMIEACRRTGVKLYIGHVIRFSPAYSRMKRQLEAGQIGEVGVAHAKRIGPHPGTASAWYNDPSQCGGVIKDLMIHDFDFMRWSLGEVKSVYAAHRRCDEVDYALVTMRFEGGAIANLEGYWGYPGPFTTAVEFAGKQGVLRYNSAQEQSLKVFKRQTESKGPAAVAVPQSPAVKDPYYRQLEHFLDCIRADSEPLVTAEDAFQALGIALAAEESANRGVPVQMASVVYG